MIDILLLEDNDLDADLLGIRLRRAGVEHDIKRVWTREDFVSALTDNAFDIILADYVLPNFDGMSALQIARELSPDTPFIFVSGTLGEDVAIESLKTGATDYVVKQKLERLPSAIKRAIDEFESRRARDNAEQRLRDINVSLEAAVRERTEERDMVWSVSQDLLLICDANGVILSANPAWSNVLGWQHDAIVGQTFSSFVATQDQAAADAAFARLKHASRIRDIDLLISPFEGGDRCHTWSFFKTPDGRYCGSGRDITERLELEGQLRQVQKMENIGQLTGGVAHDFNNLLTIILGNLESLERLQDSDASAEQKAALANALRGVDRGTKLTNSLLAFSRKQPLMPRAVNVNDLTSRIITLLGKTLGEHIQLETALSDEAWPAFVDPNQLENALINLAVNARDAMAKAGRLKISSRNRVLDAEYCRSHPNKTPGEYVEISVTDTGIGMPAEVIEKAFDPFFTTKAESQGTGLGLSQVYGFVKQSGGHVRLDSRQNVGTTVALLLPRSTSDLVAQQNDPAPVAANESGLASEFVLVVEDDPDVRELSVTVLEDAGYQVIEAEDGPQALKLLAQHPETTILFTDIGLPKGMNGRQLASAVLAKRPDMAVLLTSAYAASAFDMTDGLDRNFALLPKPFTSSDLTRNIRLVVEAHRVRTAAPRTASARAEVIRRVLIVEDDDLVRALAAEGLEAEGFNVVQAESIARAQALVRDGELSTFYAAVVDLNLPDGRGDAFAQSLRARRQDIPVILLSGDIGSALPATVDDEAVSFLAKPYRIADLVTQLHRVAAH